MSAPPARRFLPERDMPREYDITGQYKNACSSCMFPKSVHELAASNSAIQPQAVAFFGTADSSSVHISDADLMVKLRMFNTVEEPSEFWPTGCNAWAIQICLFNAATMSFVRLGGVSGLIVDNDGNKEFVLTSRKVYMLQRYKHLFHIEGILSDRFDVQLAQLAPVALRLLLRQLVARGILPSSTHVRAGDERPAQGIELWDEYYSNVTTIGDEIERLQPECKWRVGAAVGDDDCWFASPTFGIAPCLEEETREVLFHPPHMSYSLQPSTTRLRTGAQ